MESFLLNYYVNEVRFDDKILELEKETWTIGNITNEFGEESFQIKSKNDSILPIGFCFVDNGIHVGIEFQTDSLFNLGVYGYKEGFVRISRIAIVRQPYNAWLWAYLIDDRGVNVATFCGYDELDGLAKLINDMKNTYGE